MSHARGGGSVLDRRYVLDLIHGRSLMTNVMHSRMTLAPLVCVGGEVTYHSCAEQKKKIRRDDVMSCD